MKPKRSETMKRSVFCLQIGQFSSRQDSTRKRGQQAFLLCSPPTLKLVFPGIVPLQTLLPGSQLFTRWGRRLLRRRQFWFRTRPRGHPLVTPPESIGHLQVTPPESRGHLQVTLLRPKEHLLAIRRCPTLLSPTLLPPVPLLLLSKFEWRDGVV